MPDLFEVASKGVARTISINLLETEPGHWATIIERLARFKLAEALSSPAMSLIVAREVERRGGRGLSKDEMRNLMESVYPDAFRVRLR